ncbi:MAG TPA: stage II sporulation protein M [Polyangiales bacterium]|nr:stage II sporulation protein M [Polyangiales bacterium]
MRDLDANRYVAQRSADWSRLEHMLGQIERNGLKGLSLPEARRFARLYRRVSSDLVQARALPVQAALVSYLNQLVARAYSVMHAQARPRRLRFRQFFLIDFPRRVRRERQLIALAAALVIAGALTGALCVARDPFALGALIPPDHQTLTPSERVHREAQSDGNLAGDNAAAFSGWLFTHNMDVSLLVFALGLTFGVGTLALLFFNGVPLGALAMQYHVEGQDLFFWAWILPHGVTELTVVCIAGAAGFGIARGLWLPGRKARVAAVAVEAREATWLLLGALPLLGLAGAVEASVSQLHPPALTYPVKLLFAFGLASAVFAFLSRAGRHIESHSGARG